VIIDRTLAIRLASLYGPAMLLGLALVLRRPPRARATAAFLASAWNLPGLLLVNIVAVRVGWWTFAPSAGTIAGVPVDLLLGWMVLWGAVPLLLLPRANLFAVVATLAIADLALMRLAEPVVILGNTWLIGEAAALLVALLPAQLLARWTAEDRQLENRATMQAVAFSATLLWVLPAVVFEVASGSWRPLLESWHRYGGLHLQLVAMPALIGLSAVQEFAQRGRGTPIPFDPPRRLVTSGPYAYVANPMQLSMALVMLGWGALLHSPWIAVGGILSVAYSFGLAEPDERSDLALRFGKPWRAYRRHVRVWIPRWRPYHPATDHSSLGAAPARLYVSATCGRCSEVAQWFSARAPRGLEIVPAELHPTRDLSRITYDSRDGGTDTEGVAAIARALEHLNLGWAMVGWLMRLPGINRVLQILADASGAEPRVLKRTDAERCTV
jgi:protein-S-isoprenylcysteine O-methyltransferase Ste14